MLMFLCYFFMFVLCSLVLLSNFKLNLKFIKNIKMFKNHYFRITFYIF